MSRARPRPSAPSTSITGRSATAERRTPSVVPSASRPTVQTSARLAPLERGGDARRPDATGTCSTAPAAAFTAGGVSERGAVPWARSRRSRPRPGHPQHRAEVAGVGHAVERDEEGRRVGEQLVEVGRRPPARPGRARPGARRCGLRPRGGPRSTCRTRTPARRGEPFDVVEALVVVDARRRSRRCAPVAGRPSSSSRTAGRPSTCSPPSPADRGFAAPRPRAGRPPARAPRSSRAVPDRAARPCPRATMPRAGELVADRGRPPAKSRAARNASRCGDQRVDLVVADPSPDARELEADGGGELVHRRDQRRGASTSPSSSAWCAALTASKTTAIAAGVEKSSSIASRKRATPSASGADATDRPSTPAPGARARRAARPAAGRGAELGVAELDRRAGSASAAPPCGTRADRARRARRTAW